ncbi:Ger(x)C family spore germination protein [Paenibacillus glycinis]|uniref:Ger(X)C family spore germination protein n=1 Tax=Paenibacillus glycinis TaxID=2697035 RepID=A0ABW9XIA5_9BACL|nr:Ger(x)C family spore germination protein [Paenibacillus glycinis]NBD22248.1 Ger(x)C family spore germination protein [Paenibacillus glycinis]
MKRRNTAAAAVIACLLMMTGCWDRKEVKDLAIVTASGLDLNKDGTLTQSVQIVIPTPMQSSGSSSDAKSFFVIAAEGKTLADSRQRLQEKIHLKLYYSHRRVIIIGERMARHGLESVFDSFHREMDMRMRNMVFVAKGAAAESLLNYPVALEAIPADQFKNLHKQPAGRATTIMNFDATAATEGIEPTMGAFEVIQKQASGPSASSTGAEPHIKLYGVGVFKELKLLGFFNDEETRAMNWATKNMAGSFLTVYVPQGNGNVSVQILKSKHGFHPLVKGNRITMGVSVQSECELIENGTKLDFSEPANVKLLNALLSSQLTQSIAATVKKSQRLYKADVFGFGRSVHAAYPSEWKRLSAAWANVYPEVEVTVRAKTSVIGTGYVKLPLHRKETKGDVE